MLLNQRWKVRLKRGFKEKVFKWFQPFLHTKPYLSLLLTRFQDQLEVIKLLLDAVTHIYAAFMWNNHSTILLCCHIYI